MSIIQKLKLPKNMLNKIPRSFDIVGDLLLFAEFPESLEKQERRIGEAFLEALPSIQVVLKKTRKYTGRYRLPRYKILAGKRRKTTTFTESGCTFTLHIEKAYFSPRSSSERLRIASLTKRNESILVMFSGVAPLPIIISKKSQAKHIDAIEINPEAHAYAQQNVVKNKVSNISLIRGDANKKTPNKKYDRIVMPLPKGADHYLPLALKRAKKGATIHYYWFSPANQLKETKQAIKELCKTNGKTVLIKKVTPTGQAAPHVYRYCFDLLVK